MKESFRNLIGEIEYVKNAFRHHLVPNANTLFHLAAMPRTTRDMVWAFLKRGEIANHPDRRHPEYRYRMTMMCMGHYWERSTKEKLSNNPLAVEAALIFINYIYTLDDFIDEGLASRQHMPLNEAERKMGGADGYSGEDMNWHFINTVARGNREKFGKEMGKANTEKIANRVRNFTKTFFSIYESRFNQNDTNKVFTIEEALGYRDQVSAEMGRVIADIVSGMCNVDEEHSSLARDNLGMVAMVGQLHDEWWDLVEEIDSGKNILALVLGRYPEELRRVKEIIAKNHLSIIPIHILRKVAPNGMSDYYKVYADIVERGRDQRIKEDMMAMYHHLLPMTASVPNKWVRLGVAKSRKIKVSQGGDNESERA